MPTRKKKKKNTHIPIGSRKFIGSLKKIKNHPYYIYTSTVPGPRHKERRKTKKKKKIVMRNQSGQNQSGQSRVGTVPTKNNKERGLLYSEVVIIPDRDGVC